jgi:hypothetical protein
LLETLHKFCTSHEFEMLKKKNPQREKKLWRKIENLLECSGILVYFQQKKLFNPEILNLPWYYGSQGIVGCWNEKEQGTPIQYFHFRAIIFVTFFADNLGLLCISKLCALFLHPATPTFNNDM